MTSKEIHKMSKLGSNDRNAFSAREKVSRIVMIDQLFERVEFLFVIAGRLLQVLAVPKLIFSLFAGAFLVSLIATGHQVNMKVGAWIKKMQNLKRRTSLEEMHRFRSGQVEAESQRFQIGEFGHKVDFRWSAAQN